MKPNIYRPITSAHVLFIVLFMVHAYENNNPLNGAVEKAPLKDDVDNMVENEITNKLCEDFLQSIEKKFQIDLQRSVDMMLMRIKMLLQNGTAHIQDKLLELQAELDTMKSQSQPKVDKCLQKKQNETTSLAEKALHQMVICGYALIGHDPSQAVRAVIDMKNSIRDGLKPIHENKNDVNNLLKICGHEQDSLKKVIKCVISKSPLIKTSMMDVTNKLIEGIVKLTKMMAHGAMHEACLIEVIKSVEDEAFNLVKDIKSCAFGNIDEEMKKYIEADNATILDIKSKQMPGVISPYVNANVSKLIVDDTKQMKTLIRNRFNDDKTQDSDKMFKKKMQTMGINLAGIDDNEINNKVVSKNK